MTLHHQERPASAVIIFGGLAILGLALTVAGLGYLSGRGGIVVILGTLPVLWILPFLFQWAAVRESAGAVAEQWNGFSLHAGILRLAGAAPGIVVSALLGSIIAVTGMMVLFRILGRSRTALIAGIAVFAFSTMMALHTVAGTGVVLATSFLPWIVAFASMSAKDPRALGGMIASIGLFLWSGGIGARAGFVVFTLLHILLLPPLFRKKEGRRTLLGILIIDLVLVCLALFSSVQNTVFPSPPLSAIRDIFLDPRQLTVLDKFSGQGLPWTEYGAYIGTLGGALALVGLVFRWRSVFHVVAMGIIAIALTFIPSRLPFAQNVIDSSQLRRVMVLAVFAIAWATAAGIDALREITATRALTNTHWGSRLRNGTVVVLTMLLVSELLFVSATTFRVPVPASHLSPVLPFEPMTAAAGIIITGIGFALAWRPVDTFFSWNRSQHGSKNNPGQFAKHPTS